LLLADTLRFKIVDLTTYPLDATVTRELKESIATRYQVVPIGIDGPPSRSRPRIRSISTRSRRWSSRPASVSRR
jgi:hypothetical protein